ncbi:hypothetical protein WJR50_30975 [Catalinimonas sp. 4WD22]|uniref:ISAzo13-like element transposase-related protein n=1 Tax=Catalinimonas locisalis TaxID=3133978 RepID=UPI0031011BEA
MYEKGTFLGEGRSYTPYHSKYNHIERVWAALENYRKGTLLTSEDMVINTIHNITWRKVTPLVDFIDKVYQKGIKLTQQQMQRPEQYADRNLLLPKWDVWIRPSYYMGRLFRSMTPKPNSCKLFFYKISDSFCGFPIRKIENSYSSKRAGCFW